MSLISTLETIDKPLLTPLTPSSVLSGQSTRVSRLPPVPTVPRSWGRETPAGPSRQRYFFVAVRKGHQSGVYDSWPEAEKQIVDHPCPVFKTFSTRLAAEAFVAGWDGAGRHSLPSSSPRPLREHLAMNFPSAVPLTSNTSRPSYHARLLSSPAHLQVDDGEVTDFGPSTSTLRPGISHRHSASYRHSLVKVSSPLRQQVDETEQKPVLRKTASMMTVGGLLSPPSSPEEGPRPPPLQTSVMNRDRPIRGRSMMEIGTWSSTPHRQFTGRPLSGLPTPPHSPPSLAATTSPAKKPPSKRTPSGLWADSAPPEPAPKTAVNGLEVDFSATLAAPKFSRSALKKSGVIMPMAAPRSNSTTSLSSLRNKSSSPSLRSSPSSTSLNSISSFNSTSKTIRRQTSQYSSQDRLSSLAETSKKELQLNEEGLLALDALSPPRPAFMHRKSNSSLSSLSSMTSGTSAQTSSLDSCDPIAEEVEVNVVGGNEEHDLPISCTKSDADADGSVESSSMKSGFNGSEKKKGGLFKRLTKALKLEKKTVPGNEAGRRGSL